MKLSKIQSLARLGLPVDFPSEFFPRSAEAYRRALARGAEAPDDFAVGHLLVAAATAMGRNVQARVLPNWSVTANLFLALVGFKGSSKSSLADQVFRPLLHHEESLVGQTNEESPTWSENAFSWCDNDDDEEESSDDDVSQETPPVIATDVTGPAIVRLLKLEPRQLLVHTDELATLFIRNTGGTDRQLFCELADGRRRRHYRATRVGPSNAIESPHVCLLGSLTPDLLQSGYSARGDDGFLDRFLLLGNGEIRRPSWPENMHDPDLADAWSRLVDRLLRIEADAWDATHETIEVSFEPEAIDRFKTCVEQLNLVADALRMPESQRGVVNKMKGFLPKLSLIRRCLRWAAGEFGVDGPVGTIDATDADCACEAVSFLFGRWLIWRPELCAGLVVSGEPIGLQGPPGNDPALLELAQTAAATQTTVHTAERLIRYLRVNSGAASLAAIQATGPLATAKATDLQEACVWLVEKGHATWAGEDHIQVTPIVTRKSRSRRATPEYTPIS